MSIDWIKNIRSKVYLRFILNFVPRRHKKPAWKCRIELVRSQPLQLKDSTSMTAFSIKQLYIAVLINILEFHERHYDFYQTVIYCYAYQHPRISQLMSDFLPDLHLF